MTAPTPGLDKEVIATGDGARPRPRMTPGVVPRRSDGGFVQPVTAGSERGRTLAERIGASGDSTRRGVPPGVPMPTLEVSARAALSCAVTSVDRNGRLANRSVLAFMGWVEGQSVTWSYAPGPVAVAVAGGAARLDRRGYLLLPLAVRRRCRIAAGDRVLVVARARTSLLVIPMAVVDDMVAALLDPTLGGGTND